MPEKSNITLLMTREGDACERFQRALDAYAAPHIRCVGFGPLYTYNFDIQPPLSTVFDKIIVTSERALSWLKVNHSKLSNVEVVCVGPHLQKEITACGYFCAQTYPHVGILLEDAQMYAGQKILYVRGQDIARNLRETIAPKADYYEEVIVYEARAHDHFPSHIRELFESGEISYMTVFSARAAEVLVRLVRAHGLEKACTRIQCLCLSATMLKSLQSVEWQALHVAGTPDMEGLAALTANCVDIENSKIR